MSRRDDDGDDADETAATGELASLGHLGAFVWSLELDVLELSVE